MRVARATGRNAAVIKYDLLTALGAHACAGDKHLQRLVLRFITLIVARYNWQADELSVGQTEMAALWSVDARTVKRDMARLREMGWLSIRRAAARGRVATYGVEIEAILRATEASWRQVGPDFVARLGSAAEAAPATNVVPFPAALPRPDGEGAWPRVQRMLMAENPGLYAAWFAMLAEQPGPAGTLRLKAPSRFHASFVNTHHLATLRALVAAVAPEVGEVEVAG